MFGYFGPHDAGCGERFNIERMHTSKDLQIIIDCRRSIGIAGVLEMLLTADAVHDIGHGLVDPAVYGRCWDVALMQHRLQCHFVSQREDQRHVGAIAANDERLRNSAVGEFGKPHGTPTRLAPDRSDGAAKIYFKPRLNLRSVLTRLFGHWLSRHRGRADVRHHHVQQFLHP